MKYEASRDRLNEGTVQALDGTGLQAPATADSGN